MQRGQALGQMPHHRAARIGIAGGPADGARSATTAMAAGNVGFQLLARSSAPTLPTPKASAAGQKAPGRGGQQRPQFDPKPRERPQLKARINNAAAWVKPLSTGDVTMFTTQPKRASPITHCKAPDSSAIHTAI